MKKLLLIFLLYSCELPNNHRPVITAKFRDDDHCHYYYKGLGIIGAQGFDEDCNKYQIGDTIYFKKH